MVRAVRAQAGAACGYQLQHLNYAVAHVSFWEYGQQDDVVDGGCFFRLHSVLQPKQI